MNLLLMDIGNTNLKVARMKGGARGKPLSFRHYGRCITELCDERLADFEPPGALFVANVAGAALALTLCDWTRNQWGIEPQFLHSPQAALGVTNGYQTPHQLGIDRWLTLVAAHARWSVPVCIVDCGTAVTIDVMSAQGCHHGGVILPGFNLMREALLGRTRIPRIGMGDVEGALGRDTASAVAAGTLHAVAALVERIAERSRAEQGAQFKLILTGSDAALLRPLLESPAELVPDLVMEGLALMAEEMSN
ncbi:MAG: type III pantothenate kinase [Candidatus Sedimenticola endophacoides]